MTKQIAVRLPEELVDFVDRLVQEGQAASRASVVATALARDRRHRAALKDVEILRQAPSDDDLDALATHAASVPLPDLA